VINSVRFDDLQDKVVWITGAAKGMGLAMAQAFVQQGAKVALLDIDAPGLAQARDLLAIGDDRCLTLTASVTEPEAVDQAADQIIQTFGDLDVLINNAGVSMNQPSLSVRAKDWIEAININLNGVFFCAQAAARHMVKQRAGVIVCMGSIYGVTTAPDRAAYCASKSAVVALSKSLAAEWAAQGIRVNALCPGYVQTPFLDDLMLRGVLSRSTLESRIPLGSLASAEQIAQVALYMASDASSYMTGHAMVVDGGFTADGFKALSK